MSAIAPSGVVWLLHNVPIDKTYQNTLYWPLNSTGRRQQLNYFLGDDSGSSTNFVKYTFTQQYYVRHEKGSIRLSVLADNILDCNYMVFQNLNFGAEKYFFAFITSVEYINNSVTQVNFQIDVIQTWYFDYNLEPTFLERIHAENDSVGSHLEPEPVDIGEHCYNWVSKETQSEQLCVIVAVVDTAGQASAGRIYGHIYGGTRLFAYMPTDVNGINAKIAEYIVSPESIVSIYMCPKCLISSTVPTGGLELGTSDVYTGTRTLTYAIPVVDETKFGSYVPHNNKLYTYPYTYFEVFTPEGGVAKYRYEYFENEAPEFVFGGCVTPPVTLTCIPTNYKFQFYSATGRDDILPESLSLKNYPMCSWNNDTFKAWAAQTAIPMAIGLGGQALALTGAALGGSIMGVASIGGNLLGNIVNTVSRGIQASYAADRLNGQTSGSAGVATETQAFYFARAMVNESNARLIDSFFDRFGYAVNKIKEPKRKTRRFFTYVKTIGCTITGSIPADDESEICRIHDNGVTYWDTNETRSVGDFSLADSNSPINQAGG